MVITEQQVRAAEARMKERVSRTPVAREAYFDQGTIVLILSDGKRFTFRPEQAQGLEDARPDDLRQIEISPLGDGLHFPALDADLSVPALLQGVFGSAAWMRSHP
ncbi:DUF2442 domain-containing protein [Paraburkholderia caribensis]|uniref:DUF2442 domain-containing protein n=1 Tax=Paraburkholderia caribensis TaxID=75105 RepID=A0ABV0DYK5_9BURK|nr:DUF2442 domain-containing protein [Paraburkholderia caribensis]MCO4881577.1 DUF2442 domain-containing protein [Paraburkholderia caribensis]PTB23731.1 DUF2442 domain-containing protein [Paraburkholderia caribensis]